nr:MAG TPA: hypothetical protein [Caudoviricetes sp.]
MAFSARLCYPIGKRRRCSAATIIKKYKRMVFECKEFLMYL